MEKITLQVAGMTCTGCQAKVEYLLAGIPGITRVQADFKTGLTQIQASRQIRNEELEQALRGEEKYRILSGMPGDKTPESSFSTAAYRPVFLLLLWIGGLSALAAYAGDTFHADRFMRFSMAGFFLAFSFFKFIDLPGFAASFAGYDVLASRWKTWGYLYPGAELLLGIAWFTGFRPELTAAFTFGLMAFGMAGIASALLSERKVACACLGPVFRLPLSSVAMVENGLMVVMSGIMLVTG